MSNVTWIDKYRKEIVVFLAICIAIPILLNVSSKPTAESTASQPAPIVEKPSTQGGIFTQARSVVEHSKVFIGVKKRMFKNIAIVEKAFRSGKLDKAQEMQLISLMQMLVKMGDKGLTNDEIGDWNVKFHEIFPVNESDFDDE